MENPLIIDAWKAYGAAPTPMSIGEVFTALQQGTVDAQDNGTANTFANKYYEVTKYLTITEHLILPALMLISKAKYDALPEDLRKAVDGACAAAEKFQREEYLRQNVAAIEGMKEKGMIVTYPDKADFVKAAASVYEKHLPTMSAQVRKWVEDIRTKY
jgi:TRAP-type C4-dicarboxylate transport system substrate-binding protein